MVELTAGRAQPPVEERVFRLRPTGISSVVWVASFTVIALGLFREWYVAAFGFETFVQDLRHLAFNAEHCLPAWYTSLLLALSAAILAIVTASAARNGENFISSRPTKATSAPTNTTASNCHSDRACFSSDFWTLSAPTRLH